VPRRRWQRKQNFVLDQLLDIKIFFGKKKILGIVLQLILCYITVTIDELQYATQVERVLKRLETALTTQGQETAHLHHYLRPTATAYPTVYPIDQQTRGIRQQIMQSRQRANLKLALQQTSFMSKTQTINKHAPRHKGRMILFSAFEVKAASRLRTMLSPLFIFY